MCIALCQLQYCSTYSRPGVALYLIPEGSAEEDPKCLPNLVLRIYWMCITQMDDKVELCLWVTLLRIQRLKAPWGLGVSLHRRKTRGLHITFVEFIFTWHTILCTGQDWKMCKSCNFCPCCCYHNIVVFVVSIKQHFLAITQILKCTTQSQNDAQFAVKTVLAANAASASGRLASASAIFSCVASFSVGWPNDQENWIVTVTSDSVQAHTAATEVEMTRMSLRQNKNKLIN